MFINIIKSYRYVVAICDSELIGKLVEEKNIQLNIKENFYKGKKVNEEEAIKIVLDMAREDATFNIVGKKSTSVAIKAGIISKENVKEISGIPYSLVLI
jgi:uncharacterized protein